MRATLLVGGRIYSSASPDATAMAVADGQVVWVGQDTPGIALYGDSAEVVHLDGGGDRLPRGDRAVVTAETELARTPERGLHPGLVIRGA